MRKKDCYAATQLAVTKLSSDSSTPALNPKPVTMVRVEAVLVTNGPGELYTWAYPVYRELRRVAPELKLSIALIPCQYASGAESDTARSFGADAVTSPGDYLKFAATKRLPAALGDESGFVLSLGGNAGMALELAAKLGYPAYSYKFVPHWDKRLAKLFVHDEAALKKAQRLGAPPERVVEVGNLVADAVTSEQPVAEKGNPHVLLGAGTRDGFSIFLIPFVIGVVDELARHYPEARFIWPVSKLLSEKTLVDGVAGKQAAVMSGKAGQREGNLIHTPSGGVIEMVDEATRYAHMRAADLAVTIPGTNTLELGIAGVPSIVVLPMNKPEAIPLDGIGHWLGLIPVVGKYIKRYAVKLFVEGLHIPASLPNRFSKEDLMLELKGTITSAQVAEAAHGLLQNEADLAHRRERLLATMPKPGAAERLANIILKDLGQST